MFVRNFPTEKIYQTDLFNLSKIIQRILVEDEFSYGTKRVLCMRPDLCKVKDIVAKLLSFLGCHNLLIKQRSQEKYKEKVNYSQRRPSKRGNCLPLYPQKAAEWHNRGFHQPSELQ